MNRNEILVLILEFSWFASHYSPFICINVTATDLFLILIYDMDYGAVKSIISGFCILYPHSRAAPPE